MRKFNITYNAWVRFPCWVVSAQFPCHTGSTHACSPRPPRLSNHRVLSRCSLSYAGPFRMIEELKGILSRYTILMSFNQPDYNRLHALTITLDINTSFTHRITHSLNWAQGRSIRTSRFMSPVSRHFPLAGLYSNRMIPCLQANAILI